MIINAGTKMVFKIIQNLLYTKTLSMFTLMIINVQDFGFIMFFMISGLKTPKVLNYFFLLFFLFLFIETFLSMRILLFTWRIKNNFLNNNQINTNEFKKKFYFFQVKFYSFLILYYTFMHYLFTFHPLVILATSFIFVPQIISNLNIQIHELDKPYILFFALPRFFIYYYFRAYPSNIEGLKPYPIIMAISCLILILSILIIYLQGQYGSFFFLPHCLRWKQFNYFIKLSKLRKILENNLNINNDSFKQEEKGSFLKKIWNSWNSKKSLAVSNSNQTNFSNHSIISKDVSQNNQDLDFIQMNSLNEEKSNETNEFSISQFESKHLYNFYY